MAEATRGSLDSKAYFTEEWLEHEKEKVFGRTWLLAGLTTSLLNDGDYLTCDTADAGLVIRRFQGELRAFRNVCSHRGAKILSASCGNGPLQCGYHGWTYDQAGYPVGLPGHRDDFCLTPKERADLALEAHPVEVVGPFVFVGNSIEGASLRTHLGRFYDTLASLGEAFKVAPFASGAETWQANWKLAVENTLEPLHAEFVHRESLAQVIERRCDFHFDGRQSANRHALKPESARWWSGMIERSGLSPAKGFSDYWHFFVYPNLCVGLTNGTLLSVQTISPLSASACVLRSELLLPSPGETSRPAMRRGLEEFLADFNRQVLAEDREPVENCQRGIRHQSRRSLLAHSEARVAAFQAHVLADMQEP